MNREQFLEEFADILQTEDAIGFDTILEDLEEWDSLSAMTTIAFLNKEFGVKITRNDISAMKTVEDVVKKAGL